MSATVQEILTKPEYEAQEVDGNVPEGSCETTQELYRRESPQTQADSISNIPKSTNSSPRNKTPTKPLSKSTIPKNDEAIKKKSNSGIPLRLKSPINPPAKAPNKTGYRHAQVAPNLGPVINRNTLEVQFMNNKKRLMQLHTELVEKQRPLIDMHKSLLRTKKQLEELGKKVVLEDLKIVSLKADEMKNQLDGAGENPAAEAAMNLKSSIDNVLETCVKVCQKCFVRRDDVVRMLENVSKSDTEHSEFDAEVKELKREREELQTTFENTVSENEKKISELISNWQKSVKIRSASQDMTSKVTELEETVKQQHKAITDAEDNLHSLTRKFDDKKQTYEKTIAEMQERINKLEEEMKKERKTANENLMKSRNLRSKATDLETKTKEAEERASEATQKLKQLQEQMRKKEIQWVKEKDEFKKNEALLQQKFTEKQSQFDTRLSDLEKFHKTTEKQQENFCRTIETQLEIKDQELLLLEKDKQVLSEKTRGMEEVIEDLKKQIDGKDKEIDELSLKAESIPAIEYKQSESHWVEVMEYKQQISDVQNTLQQQSDQISKMQSSLKAHAQLAAALKMEKDNAIKYSTKLRDILQEARDEIEYKNRTIYKIHEKLVLKEKACDKLKAEMKEFQANTEYLGERWCKNRCQICMSTLDEEKRPACSSCGETEVGKSNNSTPQYVSESLIGMSVRKVDHLRARLDNLKKMKVPTYPGHKRININYSWSNQGCQTKPISNNLRKQIELRGKLYSILQKHADQSCEDFINLLKLTVSSCGKAPNELKPSNKRDKLNDGPRGFSSNNIKITESYNAISHFNAIPIDEIYDKLSGSIVVDNSDGSY